MSWTIELCEKLGAHFFSFVLLPLLYSRTNQPTANKNSYERSGRAEREKRIYEVDFLQGKGAHASEISDFRLIIWSNCKNCFNILNKYENPKKMFWCVSFFVFLFFPNEYSGLCQHKPAHIFIYLCGGRGDVFYSKNQENVEVFL